MTKSLGSQRLMALFFGGGLLLNFPLLALWDADATLFGVPLFPLALFVIWGIVIALLGFTAEHMDD